MKFEAYFAAGILNFALVAVSLHGAEPNTLSPEETAKGWLLLFDGRSLEGWRASESASSFRVEDGAIVAEGARSHLYYTGPVAGGKFVDFEFSAEVKTSPGANSGVYFHTRWQEEGWPALGYEVQINNSDPPGNASPANASRTGSLWGVADLAQTVVPDEEWFTLGIRVKGRNIVTTINGESIVDYTEPMVMVRPEHLAGKALSSGTLALQAADPASRTLFRSIKVRTLVEETGVPVAGTPPGSGMAESSGSAVGSIVVGAGRSADGGLVNPGLSLPEGLETISADIELLDLARGEGVQVWVEQGGNKTEPIDAVIEGDGSGKLPFDLHVGDAAFPKGVYTLVVMVGDRKRFTRDFEIGGMVFQSITHEEYALQFDLASDWKEAVGEGEILLTPVDDHLHADQAWVNIRIFPRGPDGAESAIPNALGELMQRLPAVKVDQTRHMLIHGAGEEITDAEQIKEAGDAFDPRTIRMSTVVDIHFDAPAAGAKWRGVMIGIIPTSEGARFEYVFLLAARADLWNEFEPVFSRLLGARAGFDSGE